MNNCCTTEINKLPYKIISSGKYIITKSLKFNGEEPNAITICANKVEIDLCGNEICNICNKPANGIYSNEVSHITISNGIIRGFSTIKSQLNLGYGIRNINGTNINIYNITIYNGTFGLSHDRIRGCNLENILLTNINIVLIENSTKCDPPNDDEVKTNTIDISNCDAYLNNDFMILDIPVAIKLNGVNGLYSKNIKIYNSVLGLDVKDSQNLHHDLWYYSGVNRGFEITSSINIFMEHVKMSLTQNSNSFGLVGIGKTGIDLTKSYLVKNVHMSKLQLTANQSFPNVSGLILGHLDNFYLENSNIHHSNDMVTISDTGGIRHYGYKYSKTVVIDNIRMTGNVSNGVSYMQYGNGKLYDHNLTNSYINLTRSFNSVLIKNVQTLSNTPSGLIEPSINASNINITNNNITNSNNCVDESRSGITLVSSSQHNIINNTISFHNIGTTLTGTSLFNTAIDNLYTYNMFGIVSSDQSTIGTSGNRSSANGPNKILNPSQGVQSF